MGRLGLEGKEVNCPDCGAKPGNRCDTFCGNATCEKTGKPWLTCVMEDGKKHLPSIWAPEATDLPPEPLGMDFGGITACKTCGAPMPRRGSFGWSVCVHQIEIAESTPF